VIVGRTASGGPATSILWISSYCECWQVGPHREAPSQPACLARSCPMNPHSQEFFADRSVRQTPVVRRRPRTQADHGGHSKPRERRHGLPERQEELRAVADQHDLRADVRVVRPGGPTTEEARRAPSPLTHSPLTLRLDLAARAVILLHFALSNTRRITPSQDY
jgi:hypothetical protein